MDFHNRTSAIRPQRLSKFCRARGKLDGQWDFTVQNSRRTNLRKRSREWRISSKTSGYASPCVSNLPNTSCSICSEEIMDEIQHGGGRSCWTLKALSHRPTPQFIEPCPLGVGEVHVLDLHRLP